MLRLRHACRLRLLTAAAAAGLSLHTATAQTTHSVTDPNRHALTNAVAARRIVHLAETRRIDFAIIGDSNVRNIQISGHEDGMTRALAARFGLYATRVNPYIGINSWGSGVTSESAFGYAPFIHIDSAPANLPPTLIANLALPAPSFPNSYGYLSDSMSVPYTYNGGLGLAIDHPIDITLALRFHLTHYRWRTPTSGRVVYTSRGPSYNNFAAATFRTAAATPGLADDFFDTPAGERHTSGIQFAPSNVAQAQFTRGPFFGLWQRVEAHERTTGIAYSPLLYQGGRSARAACIELNALGPNHPALREWLRQVTRLQNAEPVLVIHLMHGGNDAGDVNPSVGPIGGLSSDSPEGHADNYKGIIGNLRAAWAGVGNAPDNLLFILGPYHPRGDRLDVEKQYEEQWVLMAQTDPNIIAIRGTEMSTEDEFINLGWMQTETDYAHLSVIGYRGWSTAAVEVLQRAACPADLTHDRALSIEDVFEFLRVYFGQMPAADFNGDNMMTLDDLFSFLASWFEGC